MARTDTIFKIGASDFSKFVPSGSYKVQNQHIFTTWTDANGREHREVYRDKMSGSFVMLFNKMSDYDGFISAIESASNNAHLCKGVSLMDNESNTLKVVDVYFEFAPTRFRADNWNDYYEQFTVKVEEW